MFAVDRHQFAATTYGGSGHLGARRPSRVSPCLASATRFPAPSAASVARIPAAPTTALMTVCTSSRVAAATRHSAPVAQRRIGIVGRLHHADERGRVFGHLCAQQGRIAVGRQRTHRKARTLTGQHTQRRRANRACRSENGHTARRHDCGAGISSTLSRRAATGKRRAGCQRDREIRRVPATGWNCP